MPSPRDVLTPLAFEMLDAIAQTGSFAAAARRLGLVPSALTYRVRQIEDALDVLLFDRSSRQARVTEAGTELLREGRRLLDETDAVALRVQRIATGWEPHITIAADGVIAPAPLLELVEAFYALNAPTRVKLRHEILSGTLEALTSGQADIALGLRAEPGATPGYQLQPLGETTFVLVMAPHHPLAAVPEPIAPTALLAHRMVAVADTARRGNETIGILPGQDVLTVPTLQAKLEAQQRGLGVGFLPMAMVRAALATGRLVERRVDQPPRHVRIGYGWRGGAEPGRALQWWLAQLQRPATRQALLLHHPGHATPGMPEPPPAPRETRRRR